MELSAPSSYPSTAPPPATAIEQPMSKDTDVQIPAFSKSELSKRLNARLASINSSPTQTERSSQLVINLNMAGALATLSLSPPQPPAAGHAPEARPLEASVERVSHLAAIARFPPSQTPHESSQRRKYTLGQETGATSKGSPSCVPSNRGKSCAATKRPHGGSPKTSTLAQAYNTVATHPKNFLIHVYKTRDDLNPFRFEEEFYYVRDTMKTTIWVLRNTDPTLTLSSRPGPFAAWAAGTIPRKVRHYLLHLRGEAAQSHGIYLHLGDHIIEMVLDPSEGMKMSFKKP
jgi:hypothetical protein